MKTEYKRIIFMAGFLLGLYLAMVTFISLWDYRSEHDSYHYSWEKSNDEMSAWMSAGTFLLMILSFLSCFGCVGGIAYNIFSYLKEKNLI